MHIIVHTPGEKPQRIFENLQGSLKICKDLQKIIEDEDLQKTSEDLHLVKVGVKIGGSEDLARILLSSMKISDLSKR